MRVSVRDAAAVCGYRSPGALYRLIKAGKLERYERRTVDGSTLLELNPEGLPPLVEAVNHQSRRQVNRNRRRPAGGVATGDLPSFDDSRQRAEAERARLLELERLQVERGLISAESVDATWAEFVKRSRERLKRIGVAVERKIPRLSEEDLAIVSGLIGEALEDLQADRRP